MISLVETGLRQFFSVLRRQHLIAGAVLLVAILVNANLHASQNVSIHEQAPIELTAKEIAWLAAKHTVRVRMSDWPPYSIPNPEPAGIAVDYLKALSRRFGFKLELIHNQQPWFEAYDDVKGENHYYDLLPHIARTPEREQDFAMTIDYLADPWVIYTRKDSPYLGGLENLAGKTIAVEKGFLIAEKLKADFPDIHQLEVKRTLLALEAVSQGSADAYVGNLANANYVIKANHLDNLMAAAASPYGLHTHAMGIRKDWPELASLINKGLAAMTVSEAMAIKQNWGLIEFQPRTDYKLIWQLSSVAMLVFLAFLYWNRRLAKEIIGRQKIEHELRASELALTDERNLLLQTEQALRQLNQTLENKVSLRTAELEQAMLSANQANLAKTEFLGQVSHDLRSPLTSIMGNAQLLMMAGGQGIDQSRIIQNSAKHMLSMVNELIDYAAGNTNEKPDEAPFYIHALLDVIAQEARILAQRQGNQFQLEIAESLPPVLIGDARRIRRALSNLLQNAAKFTRNGSVQLFVSHHFLPSDPTKLNLNLIVRDNGSGIADDEQVKVFEPFYRARNNHQTSGTGLGLPIVRMLVRQMGGSINLASQPRQGTQITLDIPLAIGQEAAMNVEDMLEFDEVITPLAGNGQTIWVVEDTQEIRRLLTEFLERSGFFVRSSVDGNDFIKQIQAEGNRPPSLVITDFLMPGTNGAGVLAAVRQHWPEVPVVLISATQPSMTSPALSGFSAVLMKPIHLGELGRVLADLMLLEPLAVPAEDDQKMLPDEVCTGIHDLPGEVRARLCELVQLGAVSDLLECAEEIAINYPAHQKLAKQLSGLVKTGDLRGLETLITGKD